MTGINTYLEDECGDTFDLGDLEGDLEDLSDMSIPDLGDITIPE